MQCLILYLAPSTSDSEESYATHSSGSVILISSDSEDEPEFLKFKNSRKAAKIHHSSVASDFSPVRKLMVKPYSDTIFDIDDYDRKPKLQKVARSYTQPLGDIYQDKYSHYTKILNDEVTGLISLITPTKEDHCLRQWTINRISKTLADKIPSSTVEVFGSFNSKLYLPSSDLDIVVLIPTEFPSPYNTTKWLEKISIYLEDEGLAEDTQIISNARIPIIKFKVPYLDYNIDISLNSYTGQKSSKVAIDYLEKYPGTRQLSLLIKYYLQQRGLNEVYTGGLGSYAILLMVVSFLQNHKLVKSKKLDPLNNLGVLFFEFLDFYGNKFSNTELAISTTNGGTYSEPIPSGKFYQIPLLTIWDPTNQENNVTQGSFNYVRIKNSFSNKHKDLLFSLDSAMQQNNNLENKRSKKQISILKNIVKVSEYDIERRDAIKDIFNKKKFNIGDYLSKEDLIELS